MKEPNPLKSAVKPYRGMTPEEDAWTNAHTPRIYDRRIRVASPGGMVVDTKIAFEDGEDLTNVLRAVVSFESPNAKGPKGQTPDGKIYIFVSRFENEIGKVVYGIAEALVGDG
jgi:hypothetical protein